MIDILSSLNNFSKGLEEISEGIDTITPPNDLPFMDLEPIMIPPPPENEEDDLTFPLKRKKTKEDIGSKIIELQNSVVEKLILNNDILQDQKESLRILRNQNPTILSEVQTNLDNVLNKDFSKYPMGSFEKIETIIYQNSQDQNVDGLYQQNKIQYLPNSSVVVPNTTKNDLGVRITDLPTLNDLEVGVKMPDFTNLSKVLKQNTIDIPVGIVEPELDLNSSMEVEVFYDIKNTIPKIGDLTLNLSEFDIPKIDGVKIPVDLENIEIGKIELKNLIQKIDYIETKRSLENKITKIGYEYEDLLKKNDINEKIKINTEYIYNTESELPNQKNVEVLVNYIAKDTFSNIPTSGFKIPLNYEYEYTKFLEPQKIGDLVRQIGVDYEFKNKFNFPSTENQKVFVDMVQNPILELSKPTQQDFITQNKTINENIETFELKDGFNETINNISVFLDNFINKFDDLNSFKFSNPYDQINLKTIKNEESSKELISNVDLGKINTINKSSIPSVMMSTLDPKQFDSLMETLEKNSQVISENSKQKSSTEQVTSNSMMNFSLPKQAETKTKNEEKLVEIMSRLDDKMSVMISALSNISSWVNENRSSTTTLRHYKH